MDPGYETVLDVRELIWTLAVYVLHGVIMFLQAGLAGFLLGTGAHNLLLPRRDGVWLRRLGATGIGGGPRRRMFGAVRIALGLLLLAPIAVAAPMGASLLAAIGAFVLLLFVERQIPAADGRRGRFVRRTAITFAAITSLFMLWESEDNLVLGADLLLHSMEWRNEELAWQHSLDPKSPKLGDLAPDFELQDPEGNVRVRLSDFRGKRPVALVFGSYT
jgi:hypothetical protein